jgi:hypothetical protein
MLEGLQGGRYRSQLAKFNRNESTIRQKDDHRFTTGKVPVNIYDHLAGIDRI